MARKKSGWHWDDDDRSELWRDKRSFYASDSYSWSDYQGASSSYYGRDTGSPNPVAAFERAVGWQRWGGVSDGSWARSLGSWSDVRAGWIQACMELDATGKFGMDPGSFRFPDGEHSKAFLLAMRDRYCGGDGEVPDEQGMARAQLVEKPLDLSLSLHGSEIGAPNPNEMEEIERFALVPPLVLPGLARAFSSARERSERVHDDGDILARNGPARLAARMRGVLALEERRETAEPSVQLYIDTSSSMNGPNAIAACRLGYALAHAAKTAGARASVVAFDDYAALLSGPRELPPLRAIARRGTDLTRALREFSPALANDRGRRMLLVLSDGGVDGAAGMAVRQLRAAGVECYLCCIGFDPDDADDGGLASACDGAIGVQRSDDLITRVPRELARVLTRGA